MEGEFVHAPENLHNGWGRVEANFGYRFVSPDIARKYGLFLPAYEGIDQVVEVDVNGQEL